MFKIELFWRFNGKKLCQFWGKKKPYKTWQDAYKALQYFKNNEWYKKQGWNFRIVHYYEPRPWYYET